MTYLVPDCLNKRIGSWLCLVYISSCDRMRTGSTTHRPQPAACVARPDFHEDERSEKDANSIVIAQLKRLLDLLDVEAPSPPLKFGLVSGQIRQDSFGVSRWNRQRVAHTHAAEQVTIEEGDLRKPRQPTARLLTEKSRTSTPTLFAQPISPGVA